MKYGQGKINTAEIFYNISFSRRVINFLATILVTTSLLIAIIPLFWVLYSVITRGWRMLRSPDWFTCSQFGMTTFIYGGGAYHAIVGTLIQGLICLILSIPISVMVGIYLVEYGSRTYLGKTTNFMVDILTGVPSIVISLFIYILWVDTFGLNRSGFAVSLALVLLMIPAIIRATEEMLQIIPIDLREASYALGIPKWKTISHVLIPTAISGIVSGTILALARIMGETAPLLMCVGYSQVNNTNMFSGFMGSLPGLMYDQISTGAGVNLIPTDRLWGAALTLILLISLLNISNRFITNFFLREYKLNG